LYRIEPGQVSRLAVRILLIESGACERLPIAEAGSPKQGQLRAIEPAALAAY
jgi:hypothetical protein